MQSQAAGSIYCTDMMAMHAYAWYVVPGQLRMACRQLPIASERLVSSMGSLQREVEFRDGW
jgi:hypothetical protein